MSRIPKWIKCETCGKRAKLGLACNLGSFVRGATLSQKTKDGLRLPFGKKKAAQMQTTKDVDAALVDFQGRYKHLMPGYKRGRTYDLKSEHDRKELGFPSFKLSDPFPEQHITESRQTNTQSRSER